MWRDRMRLAARAGAVLGGFWIAACGSGEPGTTPVEPPPSQPDTTVSVDPPPPWPGLDPTPLTAFVDVEVLSMEDETSIARRTVLVRDGRIERIGSVDSVAVPDSARRIPGGGAMLIPGLMDMHTHVSIITSFNQVPDPMSAEQQGVLMVGNGVTTVLNMGDYERHDLIALRNRWLRGDAIGPSMLVGKFVRGPQDAGTPTEIAANTADARRLVDRAWSLDYDFIKLYSRLGAPVHAEAAAAARARGLPVFGHLPSTRSLTDAVSNDLSMVAHIGQYFSTHHQGQIDASLTASAIAISLANGTWVTSTLTANESFRAAWGNNQPAFDAMMQREGVPFTHPEIIDRWRWWLMQGSIAGQLDFQMPFFLEMVDDFHEAGVPVLLGTDAPELPGLTSGFAVHRELELLVDAGLTPFEALEAGTATPGRFIGAFFPDYPPVGTVTEGAVADLVLIESDPRVDVDAVKSRRGVMSRGVWYPQTELDAAMDTLATLYGN
ncbi:MAG: amidohydrolase family protein [Gemmatimonadota bacterium]